MYRVRFGGKKGQTLTLVESPAHLVVRTKDRGRLGFRRSFGATPLQKKSRDVLSAFETVSEYVEAGVEVLRYRRKGSARAGRDRARAALKRDAAVEFAGRVLVARSGRPYVYTENFFVKFDADVGARAAKTLLKSFGLEVKRELEYSRNAYFVEAPAGTGLEVFAVAEKLLRDAKVELCQPELIRDRRVRRAFDQQWHLKKTNVDGVTVDAHANVEAAWASSQGEGIVVAVIDDGVDIDHEEFRSSAKIVAPRDVTRKADDPRPKGLRDDHGTACAGVACADGSFSASGVAPRARLLPIRLASGLGSQDEADAFVWATDHGADVISCSWGPTDGDFANKSDPLHKHVEPLPDSTRLAIDYAVTKGRAGRGAVVLFAAGNGNESVDNDGYASNPKVIAVAACDDRGKKAPYSDHGKAVFCAFPSNHYFPSVTPGIWTTDRSGGLGYNFGDDRLGDAAGRYTNSFGGTSSACPGAAGVAALVLARNPELRADEVRDVLGRSCDRIDPKGGRYGKKGRSRIYGYGRLNALRAVELAVPPRPAAVSVHSAVKDVPIRDFKTAKLAVSIANKEPVRSIKVTVHLDHSWISDLSIKLRPPAVLGIPTVTLHARDGGDADNLLRSYDPVSTPALGALVGRSAKGVWTIEVKDEAEADEGVLRSFALEIGQGE
jgi:subtilisin family serine protease